YDAHRPRGHDGDGGAVEQGGRGSRAARHARRHSRLPEARRAGDARRLRHLLGEPAQAAPRAQSSDGPAHERQRRPQPPIQALQGDEARRSLSATRRGFPSGRLPPGVRSFPVRFAFFFAWALWLVAAPAAAQSGRAAPLSAEAVILLDQDDKILYAKNPSEG